LYGRIAEATLMIEHRHDDGSWGRLERAHHDVTAHDPEREWAKGKILYTCNTCDEQVLVSVPDDEPRSE
jgi:hypothetical protein